MSMEDKAVFLRQLETVLGDKLTQADMTMTL